MTELLNLFGMALVVLAIALCLVTGDWLATDGVAKFRAWRLFRAMQRRIEKSEDWTGECGQRPTWRVR